MIIERIVFGLLAIAIGTLSLKYNFQIVNNTARLEFIESKLGYGTTYLVYKLLSILLVLGGILYITGLYKPVLDWLLTPFVNLFPHGSSNL